MADFRTNCRRVHCPKCGAPENQFCVFTGKGAQKAMRIGRNHEARVSLAISQNLHIDTGEREFHGWSPIDWEDVDWIPAFRNGTWP